MMTIGMICGFCALLALFAVGTNVPELRDALLKVTKALPNGAATITSDPIDTATGPNGSQPKELEFLLTAPALVVGDLPDAATMKRSIVMDTDPAMGSPTTLYADILVQTGAGGAGAAAASVRFKLPSYAERYIAFTATNSAAGDASDKSDTLEAVF